MIPKKIHYCWFGKKDLPESAIICIASWKKFFPDYEIIEWNEENYSINDKCEYVREAYSKQKWAFVSDYVRFDILYNYGGIYFDTDVEVIKSFDDIIKKGAFFGKEIEYKDNKIKEINPGLGMASESGNSIYKEIMDYYEKIHFDIDKQITICEHVTNIFENYGYKGDSSLECIKNISIYPVDYFCPMDYLTGEIKITNNTHSIHRYMASWHPKKEVEFKNIERKLIKKYGEKIRDNILFRIYKNLYCNGICGTIKKVKKKLVLMREK